MPLKCCIKPHDCVVSQLIRHSLVCKTEKLNYCCNLFIKTIKNFTGVHNIILLLQYIYIYKNDSLIISGDLNARVGYQPIPDVVGTFGEECVNRNGQTLREFASFNDFKIANTFFRKKINSQIHMECSRIQNYH